MRIQTSIKQHGFLMPLAGIRENDRGLSINRYKEMVHKEMVYDKPAEILDRITDLDSGRELLAKKLKEILQ
jgi:type I restriction enzyme M protein